MASREGWEPEPMFADALAGSGGLAEPADQPLLFESRRTDFFPDALSAPRMVVLVPTQPLPGPVVDPARPRPDVGLSVGGRQRQRPPVSGTGRADTLPPVWSSSLRAPGSAPPGRLARPSTSTYLPAAVAPPSGRRPVAGVGYVSPPVQGNLLRPPAYLPQNQGLAQVRAALQRTRQGRSPAPNSWAPPSGSAPARTAPTVPTRRITPVKKGSSAWGVLVFLAITLFASGAGQKIIAVLTEFLQRR
ncbi:MAG: hypothetical protein ACR2M5_06615 [Nakamurella sp.]